ncbi:hypothetical protein Nepgr_018223 [Nepenthes gracilis]|uniref:Uncharacterized protein n=1 Tax=Nepenthes gracilis TaxID=150966 RepID=A0AAD3STQ1_NEPGR|nr:hypothetical protein Nepgr_018223 [Nepenthes gracilis]
MNVSLEVTGHALGIAADGGGVMDLRTSCCNREVAEWHSGCRRKSSSFLRLGLKCPDRVRVLLAPRGLSDGYKGCLGHFALHEFSEI